MSKLIAEAADLITLKRQAALLLRSDPKSETEISADELAEAFQACLMVLQQEVFDRELTALGCSVLTLFFIFNRRCNLVM